MVDRNNATSLYVGNLDEQVDEEILFELMLQAAPVVSVHLPKDRLKQTNLGYGFVEFLNEEHADWAAKVMATVKLFGRPLKLNRADAHARETIDIGAQLFVGNLDPLVDEKLLQSTFSVFGKLVETPRIARDDSGYSKGHGFVTFDSFESSDRAISSMNGQYLMNQPCTVGYAVKDVKGNRHGDEAERILAAEAKKRNLLKPQQKPQAKQAKNRKRPRHNPN